MSSKWNVTMTNGSQYHPEQSRSVMALADQDSQGPVVQPSFAAAALADAVEQMFPDADWTIEEDIAGRMRLTVAWGPVSPF